MENLRRRSLALLWVVLALFASGASDAGTLSIEVRVEPTIQVATAFPAQLLVGFDSSGSGFVVFRVAFLCAPPSAPFVVTSTFGAAAGDASSVHAWVVPLDSGTPSTCGQVPVPQLVPPPPAGAVGVQASTQVGLVVGCGAGDVHSATLVVGG